jgi:mannose-1-phosphate guanylyltransferase
MSSSPHVVPVVLAGGVGSRFWPLSRRARPKQLLDLFGEGPMLRVTLARTAPLAPPERAIVVTSTALADEVARLLPEVSQARILAEPSGKNTAPAIAWAAIHAMRDDPEAILAVLPSDHHIADTAGFQRLMADAVALAATGRLVTLGVVPTHPETGYGYIERAAPIADSPGFLVDRFVEKPNLETALTYLASGRFLWNAGMFFMPARLFLDELLRFKPTLHAAMTGGDVLTEWSGLESVSVDYAVFERSDKVAVIPGAFGWSDVGSWRSLADHQGTEPSFIRGDVIELDGRDNVLFAEGGVVATVGVSGLIVVHTKDATFVCRRDDAQRTREVVAELTRRGREDLL